ncbi:hypothetical protein LIA77_06097 [Sarocladium implicatum]|nr:hypothetical protein LIA77_06097 [Sarocladium implicatum]
MAQFHHPKSTQRRQLGNPTPLGLCAFALTTFVLSCINVHARGETKPNIVVPLALAYGGLVQLLAGMWEMAVGNTFGATALSSYGGFWISYAVLLTPAWHITDTEGPYAGETHSVIAFLLTGWFIFTTLLVLRTLRSTAALFALFLTLDLAFLCLMCESYALSVDKVAVAKRLQMTGGVFGFMTAFTAWYNALAQLQDTSNSFFVLPVYHFPWSDKDRGPRPEEEGFGER